MIPNKARLHSIFLYALQLFIFSAAGDKCDCSEWMRPAERRDSSASSVVSFILSNRQRFSNGFSSCERSISSMMSGRPEIRLWRAIRRAPIIMSSQSSEPVPVDERATVFVGNLPWALDSYGLRKLFEPYGKIRIAQISWDDRTDRSR